MQVIQADLPTQAGDVAAPAPTGRVLPPRRYVCANQKGGQGKTTTSVGLGAEFAASGYRVRILDCDPQYASLTYWLPPQWDSAEPGDRYDMSHVLMNEATLDHATWPTAVPGLFIVPSYHTVNRFEALRPPGADLVLRQALDEAQPYDVTLIDCPPNLGLLTVTAIASADDVIIPVLPGGLDIAGVSDLNQTLGIVRKRLNPALTVTAVAHRRISSRSRLADAIERQLLADYPDAVHQVIRQSVRVAEAPTVNQTLRQYAPDAPATADYKALAKRLDDRAAALEAAR